MLNVLKKFDLLIILLLCAACGQQNESYLAFDNRTGIETFPVIFEIHDGEPAGIDKSGIIDLYIVDSLMLVSSMDPTAYLSVIDLDCGTNMGNFFHRGNGPGELLSVPFLSNSSIVSTDESTFMIFRDGKGNLLRWDIESSLESGQPVYEVINDSIPSSQFYTLYVNDSTFICREVNPAADGQNRFLLKGGRKELIPAMETLNGKTIPVKGDGYLFNIVSSAAGYSIDENIVVEASVMLNTINMYSLDGNVEKTIFIGKKPDSIADECAGGMRNLKDTFGTLRLYEKLFAVMYNEGKQFPEKGEKIPEPKILMFDWSGNPVAELQMSGRITSFDIDFRNEILYVLDVNDESIMKYDISKVLSKIP